MAEISLGSSTSETEEESTCDIKRMIPKMRKTLALSVQDLPPRV
jgi:hypothetical protein